MKKTYKNLLCVAASTGLCLLFTFTASAQRPNSNNNNSGSSNSTVSRPSTSTSSSAPVSRPSGGSSSNVRPGNNNVGMARPSIGQQRGISSQQQRPGFQPRQGTVNQQGVGVRGNYGFAPRQGNINRVGVASTVNGGAGFARPGNTGGTINSYRNSPRVGSGHNGYWANHGYFHNNRGYYNSYYLPRLGFSIGALPYGYYPFYFGDYEYFYSDGLYYQFENNQYTVVEPPIGAQVTSLPDKAQSIVINGQQYYELNGVYYRPVTKDDGSLVYEIAGKDGELNTNSTTQDQQQGPQMGDVVLQLPQDCRKIKVNGQILYVSPDGVYYQEQVDSNNNKSYKIVGLPSDENGQN